MSAYIPEIRYGFTGRDEHGQEQHGLLPWPEHLRPRKKACKKAAKREPADAALAEADGVFFLTLSKHDRAGIAYTIERLINMLDDMEDDPDIEEAGDLEPSLGWPEYRGPCQLATPQQLPDECEDVSEDEGAITGDDEYSLGTTEEIDQERRLRRAIGVWELGEGEPDLGWTESHGAGIRGEQNCIDDREHDDERQDNGDEGDYSETEDDSPLVGSGSGGADRQVAQRLVEKARRLKNGDVVREFDVLKAGDIPMLRLNDFDRLPWADRDARH